MKDDEFALTDPKDKDMRTFKLYDNLEVHIEHLFFSDGFGWLYANKSEVVDIKDARLTYKRLLDKGWSAFEQ